MEKVNTKRLFHCTYALSYHFVFVTKYRHRCLTDAMLTRLGEIVSRLAETWGGRLVEMNGEADHLHFLVEMSPKAAPSAVANNIKTVTSRLLRKEFPEALGKVYKTPVLWSRTYFVASCGGAPLEIIKQYIQQQERPL